MPKKKSKEIPPVRKEWISELAESIALRYVSKGSVDLVAILKDYRITHSIGDYGDSFDGLIEHKKGRFHIYLNSARNQSDLRLRFSLAHELGHYFIDEHAHALASGLAPSHSSFTGFASDSIVEREADHFAACLLMPQSLVLTEYRRHRKFTWSIIEQLEKRFEASTLSVVYRVVNLDLHPMIVVKGVNGKIVLPPWRSKDFFYLESSIISEDTLMYAYFKEGKKSLKTLELYAPDWFPYITTETPIYERCIFYDSLETCYSVIWAD